MARFGLRVRVAVALLVTAAVALAVAAFTLLSPLEHRLREQEVRDLTATAVQSRAAFRGLEASSERALVPKMRRAARRVATISGARVAVLDGRRHVVFNSDPDAPDGFRDVPAALGTNRPVRRILDSGRTPEARVALRFVVGDQRFVLAMRKRLNEPQAAAAQVRRAFRVAAAAALAAAVLLAVAFAATVGRRLTRLHAAVRAFALGRDPSEFPHDRATDEVGELNRAFAAMAARVQHEEEVRREFVSTASHELRTPLMSLEGRLELLSDELDQAKPNLNDGRRQLTEARTQAARLSRLATDLLDLSRLDAGVELRREPVEMAELVRAVSAEFAARAARNGTRIELEAQPVEAAADPTATARVLRIVLDNALRASPNGDPIDVAVARNDGWVEVSVTDRGPGIEPGDRDRIFQRFTRGSRGSGPGGFGLGLAIGRELSERMGGKLELERSDDSGSVFALRLPSTPNEIPT